MLPDAFTLRLRDPTSSSSTARFDIGAEVELHFAAAGSDGALGERLQRRDRDARARVRRAGACSSCAATTSRTAEPQPQARALPGHDGRRHRAQGRRRGRPEAGRSTHRGRVVRLRAAEQRDRLGLPLAARRRASTSSSRASTRSSTSARAGGAAAARRSTLVLGRGRCSASARASPACSRSTRSTSAAGTRRPSGASTATATPTQLDSRDRPQARRRRHGLGGGKRHGRRRPVTTASEADALAQSTLDRLGQRLARGRRASRVRRPDASAPARKVQIDGVGTRFGGDVPRHLSRRTSSAARSGLRDALRDQRPQPRTLLDLITPRHAPAVRLTRSSSAS